MSMYAHICAADITLNLFVLWPHLCKLINNQTYEVPNSSPPHTPCLKANQFMKMSSGLSSISVQLSPLRMLLCTQTSASAKSRPSKLITTKPVDLISPSAKNQIYTASFRKRISGYVFSTVSSAYFSQLSFIASLQDTE